jgi:hypothetical protein
MKVKDLIEELKKYPEDLEVVGQWEDNIYGYDITQELVLYTTTVKNTEGRYGLGHIFQYNKELPSTDVKVLVIKL